MRPLFNSLVPLLAAVSLIVLAAQGHGQPRDPRVILWSVDWKPDGSQFAVGGEDALWVFHTETFERTSLLPSDVESYTATAVAWSPSGRQIAVTDQNGKQNGLYDHLSGTKGSLAAGSGRGVSWSLTGDRFATTSAGDGHLRIWKSDGSLLHNIARYKKALGSTGVSWRPSGDRIVTIGKYITLHDAEGKVLKQITHRAAADLRLNLLLCVEWHPSGEFFAIGDYGNGIDDPVIQFWSAEGELLKDITIKGGAEVRNISWNSDGSLLASASDILRIWTRDGELQHKGESPDLLWGVDWHPDGNSILTSSIKGRVTIWDATAKVIKKVVAPSKPEAKRPMMGSLPVSKVLVLGNSITLHGPAPAIGWTGNWGMAASAKEKDFVHLLKADLAEATGAQPRLLAQNIAGFERDYNKFDISAGLKTELEFRPDIVVVAIGENVPDPATDVAREEFAVAFARLLAALKGAGTPAIFVRSSFWPHAVKDAIMRKASADAGATFIDIAALGRDPSNAARAEREIKHAGVAGHPGDKGMRAIADAIFASMEEKAGPG